MACDTGRLEGAKKWLNKTSDTMEEVREIHIKQTSKIFKKEENEVIKVIFIL